MKGEIYTQLKGWLQYRNEKLRRGEVRNGSRSRRLRIFRERVPERGGYVEGGATKELTMRARHADRVNRVRTQRHSSRTRNGARVTERLESRDQMRRSTWRILC